MKYFALVIVVLSWITVSGQHYMPIDAESSVEFKVKNFGSTVKGRFTGLSGKVVFDVEAVTNAAFDVTVKATSIDTGIGMRDNHLRKNEYLSTADYPTLRFVSSKVVSDKLGHGTVTGLLTIKKITPEVSLPFTYSLIGETLTLKGEFHLNRRDYDVGGNSISLSDEVMVVLRVIAKRFNER